MGLLKTLFFILLFYYGFKYLTRLLAPFLVNRMAKSMNDRAKQRNSNYQNKNTVKEGETIIDKAPTNKNNNNNNVGEYVDFEEID